MKVVKGYAEGRKFYFCQKTMHVGSAYLQNDLVLNLSGISDRHFCIRHQVNGFYLRNISKDQTILVNGNAIGKGEKTRLKTGSTIDLGEVGFRFALNALKTDFRPGADYPNDTDEDIYGSTDSFPMALSKKIPPRTRRLIGIGGLVIAAVLLLNIAMRSSAERPDPKTTDLNESAYTVNLSSEPIALPAKEAYGNIRGRDKSHADKIIFIFNTNSLNVELFYTAGDVDSEDEVAIRLNGQQIGTAPMAKESWGEETVLPLPAKYLLKDSQNRLVFDNIYNPPGKKNWGVKNIRVNISPANRCDRVEAEKFFDLGEELYLERSISPGNLYLAYQYYRNATVHMEECDEKPEFYSKAESKVTDLKKEVDRSYNDLMFAFKKAVNIDDYFQARQILRDIVALIPEESDKRNIKASEALEKFDAALNKK